MGLEEKSEWFALKTRLCSVRGLGWNGLKKEIWTQDSSMEELLWEREKTNSQYWKVARGWAYDRDEIIRMTINYFLELFTTSNLSGIEEVVEAVESKINLNMASLLGLTIHTNED